GDPLVAMGAAVEVLRRRGGDAQVVQGLPRELHRIDAVVRGLLDYARPGEEPLQPIEPGAVLRSTFALLEAQGAFKPVRAALDVADGVPRVMGRGHLLEQALVNLLLNAVDAAGAGRGGGVVILGARRWAYEPGRAARKCASDDGAVAFPRT